MRIVVLVVFFSFAGVVLADTPPPTAAVPASPQQLAAALVDELEPVGESDAARIDRQRAELALTKRFGFQPAPIDPVAVRFRTSYFPILHRAAVALATTTNGAESPRSLLGQALQNEAAVLRLVPFVVAEMLSVVSKDPASHSDWENQLTKQLSFVTAILGRTAALRLGDAAATLPALDPAVAAKIEAPVDLLAVDYRGPKTSAALAQLPMPAASWDTANGAAAFRAAFVTALRSLGGARPSPADLALLGYDPATPAAGLIAAYGPVLQPLVAQAAAQTDFAAGWAAALRTEVADEAKLSVDLRARTGSGAGSANLFVFMIKMIAIDPQIAARKQ